MDRRHFLNSSATLTLMSPFMNRAFAAATDDSRFVLVILRGGLDGTGLQRAIFAQGVEQQARRCAQKKGDDDSMVEFDFSHVGPTLDKGAK